MVPRTKPALEGGIFVFTMNPVFAAGGDAAEPDGDCAPIGQQESGVDGLIVGNEMESGGAQCISPTREVPEDVALPDAGGGKKIVQTDIASSSGFDGGADGGEELLAVEGFWRDEDHGV